MLSTAMTAENNFAATQLMDVMAAAGYATPSYTFCNPEQLWDCGNTLYYMPIYPGQYASATPQIYAQAVSYVPYVNTIPFAALPPAPTAAATTSQAPPSYVYAAYPYATACGSAAPGSISGQEIWSSTSTGGLLPNSLGDVQEMTSSSTSLPDEKLLNIHNNNISSSDGGGGDTTSDEEKSNGKDSQNRHSNQQGESGDGTQKKKVTFESNILYKTILCKEFLSNGVCPRTVKCQFAHGESDLRDPTNHPLYRTSLCKQYLVHGSCARGDNCYHAHFYNDLRIKKSKFRKFDKQQKLAEIEQLVHEGHFPLIKESGEDVFFTLPKEMFSQLLSSH